MGTHSPEAASSAEFEGAGASGGQKPADSGGHGEAYGERGVWVLPGMTAEEIMKGAAVLVREFDVSHYEAREMVRQVLRAIRPANV